MSADVVVVGAGLVGCATAVRLAQAGLAVTVLERSVPGAEASSVAAGILGPTLECEGDSLALALGRASRARHATLAAELREATGVDVGYERCGLLRVSGEAGASALEAHARFLEAEGEPVERLDARALQTLEPALAPTLVAGLRMPEDGQVEPRPLLRALAAFAAQLGVRFVSGRLVRGLRTVGDRVHGVETDGGFFAAGHVVVAAGAWTSLVPGLPLAPDAVRPVRGQVVHTAARARLLRHVVFGDGVYVVPRADGRVVLGATMEDVGFDRTPTLAGIASLVMQGCAVAPALGQLPLLDHAVSFRPATRDHRPFIGPVGPAGLVIASGHHRNGVLLAPITADLVRDVVVHGTLDARYHALLPDPRERASGGPP